MKLSTYVMTFVCLSIHCSNKQYSKLERPSFHEFHLSIISPYGCLDKITVRSDGSGVLQSGRKNNDIDADLVGFDSLFYTRAFQIQDSHELNQLDRFISSIVSKASIKRTLKYDINRFRLFVDGVDKIDVYGETVELFGILKLIGKALPTSQNRCEYFQRFK